MIPPPPHNLTSRKARARAQRTLCALAQLEPPPPPRDGDGDAATAPTGDDGDERPAATAGGLIRERVMPVLADTAIERRARAAPTVAATLCSSTSTAPPPRVPDLPWRDLPPPADPRSVLAPEHAAGPRGRKKVAQVANFAAALRWLMAAAGTGGGRGGGGRPLRVVDFGCGSGAVVLALAALFPAEQAVFAGVDFKLEAIDLLRARAARAGLAHVTGVVGMAEDFCWGCCDCGGGEDGAASPHAFDVALALHACGNATDAALEVAARCGAAFAVSPCCLGKLRFSTGPAGGSSFHPTLRVLQSTRRGAGQRLPPLSEAVAAQGARLGAVAEERRRRGCPWVAEGGDDGGRVRVRHPRSEWLRSQLVEAKDGVDAAFAAIARAADGVNHGELLPPPPLPPAADDAAGALELRAARAAKAVVEMDRAEAMREAHGYAVALLRLSPVAGGEEDEAAAGGARDDLIVGVPPRAPGGGASVAGVGVDRWARARDALLLGAHT
jgi:SAM-dependent methyltransferase